MTTPSDLLGPLGDAILEGTEDNLPEFTVEYVAYVNAHGRVIEPEEYSETQPTTMLLTTAVGLKFKMTIEAVPDASYKKDVDA